MSREQITKKVRFEVFKRDGFQCSYCGKTPPVVVLEIDHIEPVSKGGSSDETNLITACFDCNRGKGATPLDKVPSPLIENMEILKEKEAQLKSYRKLIATIKRRETRDINDIDLIYSDTFKGWQLVDKFKKTFVKKFLSLLPKHEVVEAMELACSRIADPDNAIKYFCGICWKRIKGVDPIGKIEILWKDLSYQYSRGVGYLDKTDLPLIQHIPLETIKKHMTEALSCRSHAYWKAFMKILRDEGIL